MRNNKQKSLFFRLTSHAMQTIKRYPWLIQLARKTFVCFPFLAKIVGKFDNTGYIHALYASTKNITPEFFSRTWPALFIDSSYLHHVAHTTGIQRVIQNLTYQLSATTLSQHRRALPIQWKNHHLALAPTLLPSEISGDFPPETFFAIQSNDILLMPDPAWDFYKKFEAIFAAIHAKQGKIYSIVHDLIPLQYPEFFGDIRAKRFAEWLEYAVQHNDGLICVSKTVADSLIHYITEHRLSHLRDLTIGYFHLGSDFKTIATEQTRNKNISALFSNKTEAIFLMVGTIEPRKGHTIVLQAFEQLWQQGHTIKLCIAGKSGWMMEKFIRSLQQHPQLNKKLFWFDQLADHDICYAYQKANALILASKAEGFGLPLIEAAHFKLPVICSDIPIFKEIGQNYVTYFKAMDSGALAKTIDEWLNAPTHPNISALPHLSWAQSSAQLINIINNNQWYHYLPATAESE